MIAVDYKYLVVREARRTARLYLCERIAAALLAAALLLLGGFLL